MQDSRRFNCDQRPQPIRRNQPTPSGWKQNNRTAICDRAGPSGLTVMQRLSMSVELTNRLGKT
jgi:hypothetical protein